MWLAAALLASKQGNDSVDGTAGELGALVPHFLLGGKQPVGLRSGQQRAPRTGSKSHSFQRSAPACFTGPQSRWPRSPVLKVAGPQGRWPVLQSQALPRGDTLTPGPAFPPECQPLWHEKGWLIRGLFLNPPSLDLVAKGPRLYLLIF